MSAVRRFVLGLWHQPTWVRLWVGLLIAFNGILPLAFIAHRAAQLVLVVFMLGGLLMVALTAASGFTRLLGLGHVLWIPLVGYLFWNLSDFPTNEPLGWWIRGLLVVNSISLLIDVTDVVRYACGERAELVE